MKYIEALNEFVPTINHQRKSLFLGGGITNCPDWQQYVTDKLISTNLVVLNPRRKNFPIDDPSAARQQIEWEFKHLELATVAMFWFPCETLCPITLFELGKWIVGTKKVFIGCHPEYQRLIDVQIQSQLVRPSQVIHTNLDSLVEEILND